MGKSNLGLYHKVIDELKEMIKEPIEIDDTYFKEEGIASLDRMDSYLKDWLKVFEEDQVKVEGNK